MGVPLPCFWIVEAEVAASAKSELPPSESNLIESIDPEYNSLKDIDFKGSFGGSSTSSMLRYG